MRVHGLARSFIGGTHSGNSPHILFIWGGRGEEVGEVVSLVSCTLCTTTLWIQIGSKWESVPLCTRHTASGYRKKKR